jgi:hypothetical protein
MSRSPQVKKLAANCQRNVSETSVWPVILYKSGDDLSERKQLMGTTPMFLPPKTDRLDDFKVNLVDYDTDLLVALDDRNMTYGVVGGAIDHFLQGDWASVSEEERDINRRIMDAIRNDENYLDIGSVVLGRYPVKGVGRIVIHFEPLLEDSHNGTLHVLLEN